jgi:murein DD-endopeptidase MepM/ murein hydrolase activator NlpD
MPLSHKLRLFFTYFITLITISFWVVTVFWTDLIFDAKISKIQILGKNIFLDGKSLSSTYIFYTSKIDLSKYKLKSSCNISSKLSWKIWEVYSFKITYLNECFYWLTYLQTPNKTILKDSRVKLKVFSKARLFDLFVDRNDKSLLNIKSNIENNILKFSKQEVEDNLLKLQINRKISELKYQKSFLEEIINSRKQKYISPVLWYNISKNKSKIPNARRPYRKNYTDWIHHWWDISAPLWTPTVALDNWKIIRIVSDFVYKDLDKLKKTANLTFEDKLNNLDILRWNQVWLKTSSWDVVFYSHLDEVSYNLRVWDLVKKSTILWKVWNSWVPDRNYKHFHLHFAIQKNPYLRNKVWKYTFMDYMKWDWYFKWKSLEYVAENGNDIFK